MKIVYEPMSTAPKNRSIVVRLRDGREIMVRWDKRSGPPRNSYLGHVSLEWSKDGAVERMRKQRYSPAISQGGGKRSKNS